MTSETAHSSQATEPSRAANSPLPHGV
jgi:hypothetical protein